MNSETIIKEIKSHHKEIKKITDLYYKIDRFEKNICSPFIYDLKFDKSNIDSLRELLPIIKYWKNQIEDYGIDSFTSENATIIKRFKTYKEKIIDLDTHIKSCDEKKSREENLKSEKKFQEERLKLEKKKFTWQKISVILSIIAIVVSITALLFSVLYG
ncbi:MAG: hypothetical protein JXA54_10185 [Candidatus Heimdallarchaeota archaeon]|nr:hypothetical protein [Candidatus Heimdallarchaeota archaeon]